MLRTLLVLGRVSNLPTVWTNVLTGFVLVAAVIGAGLETSALVRLMATVSLFYIGGMYLNDAFDAEIDAAERSDRPIPTGRIARKTVFTLGSGFLVSGLLLGFSFNPETGLAGIALAGAILLYDWLHKRTALSPVIMGACRFLTYVMAGLAVGGFAEIVVIAAAGLFAHVVGLTYAAKQEAYNRISNAWPLAVLVVPVLIAAWITWAMASAFFMTPLAWGFVALYAGWLAWSLRFLFRRAPGDIPRGVVSLIAGIALYDAAITAAMGATVLAVLAVLGFGLTLVLQRIVPGT